MVRRLEVPKPEYDENFKNLFNNQLDSAGILTISNASVAVTLGLHYHTVVHSAASGADITLPNCSDAVGKTIDIIATTSAATVRIRTKTGDLFSTATGGSPSILDWAAEAGALTLRAISTSKWAAISVLSLSDATNLAFADVS